MEQHIRLHLNNALSESHVFLTRWCIGVTSKVSFPINWIPTMNRSKIQNTFWLLVKDYFLYTRSTSPTAPNKTKLVQLLMISNMIKEYAIKFN